VSRDKGLSSAGLGGVFNQGGVAWPLVDIGAFGRSRSGVACGSGLIFAGVGQSSVERRKLIVEGGYDHRSEGVREVAAAFGWDWGVF